MKKYILTTIFFASLIIYSLGSQEKEWTIYGIANGLPHDLVNSIVTAPNGNVLVGLAKVGSQQGGLGIFNGKSWNIVNSSTENFKENYIMYIATDKNKIIVHYLNEGYSIFNGESWDTLDMTGLDTTINTLEPIIFDKNGNMWAGLHYQSKFFRYGRGIGFYDTKWHIFPFDSSYYKDSRHDIFDIELDRVGNLWVSTWNGLFKRDIEGIWKKIDSLDGFIPEHPYKIECDSKNNIWGWANRIQFNSSYLCKFDANSWSYFNNENIDILQNRINALQVDKNDNVWVGTADSGVFKFDGVNCTRYFLKEWNYFVYGGGEPNSITFDSTGRVWILIGSGHGIYVLNPNIENSVNQELFFNNMTNHCELITKNEFLNFLILNSINNKNNIKIYSVSGTLIMESNSFEKLDISRIANGIYFVEINNCLKKFLII